MQHCIQEFEISNRLKFDLQGHLSLNRLKLVCSVFQNGRGLELLVVETVVEIEPR